MKTSKSNNNVSSSERGSGSEKNRLWLSFAAPPLLAPLSGSRKVHPSSLSDVCPSISDRYSSSHSMNLRFPPSSVKRHLILRILFAKLLCDIRAVRTPRMTCRRSSAFNEYSAVKWSAICTAVRSSFTAWRTSLCVVTDLVRRIACCACSIVGAGATGTMVCSCDFSC